MAPFSLPQCVIAMSVFRTGYKRRGTLPCVMMRPLRTLYSMVLRNDDRDVSRGIGPPGLPVMGREHRIGMTCRFGA